MYIMDDNIRLNAYLDMPEGDPEKCPLVIIIHGFTGHSEEPHILATAKTMNEMGYATLRMDMYGHGKSDGKFRDHTLFKWLTNAMTVIDYARQLPFVTDLYLCGHSQGGLTVILAAALKHEFIRGIIPMSPAVMIPDGCRKGLMAGVSFDPERIPEEFEVWDEYMLGGNYVRTAQMIHVDEAIARYTGPVLVIHGTADEAVPFHYAEETVSAYRNAKLAVIPDDTHCYDHHLDLVCQAIREWLPTTRKEMQQLETERLILRPWEESDAENLYEYAKDPAIGPIAGWPPHHSIEESLDVIRNVFCDPECYAICLKEDGKAIGAISLKLNGNTNATTRDDECELGYWLGKPFWGKGIVPEAARELIRHGFEDLGMRKIWCCYYEGNEKSRRVQEKCGFRYQRTNKDVDVPLMHEKRTDIVNCLTKEEWEQDQTA